MNLPKRHLSKQEDELQVETYSKQGLRGLYDRYFSSYGEKSQYNPNFDTFKRRLKGKDMEIWLLLADYSDLHILEKIEKKIPDLKCLKIASCGYEYKTINSFFKNYFPDKVGSFYFNDESYLIPIEKYMEELIEISGKVEEELFLYHFSISQEQLETLISLNKNKIKLGFIKCKLKITSVPDFRDSLEGSTLELLDLTGCGHEDLSDWEDNETHFENLVKGLAQSEDMKKNLAYIIVQNCELPKEEPIKMLKKYKFERAIQYNTPKSITSHNQGAITTASYAHSSSNPDDPKECTIF